MSSARERGQAITLSYTLSVAIATLLVAGLFVGGAGFISDQRERAAEAQLQVVGQQIASGVEATDRLAVTTEDNATVRLVREPPGKIVGSTYDIELVEEKDPYLRLNTTNPDVSVTVELANQTAVDDSEVTGGTIHINYTSGGTLRLEEGEK